MSLKIFLSHAWNDKVLASFKAIESKLSDCGYEVWVDKHQIEFGESISAAVEQGIRDSDLVLVLWSPNAHNSKAVMAEIETATRDRKLMIACRITDYEPGVLDCFRDRKYFVLDGHRLTLGLLHLSQYLARLRIRDSADMQADQSLMAQTEALGDMLAEADDWAAREEKGATGNAGSGAYVLRMLEVGKKLVESSGDLPEEKARIIRSFSRIQEIVAEYPDPTQEAIMVSRIRAVIDEVDPRGQSPMLQQLQGILRAHHTVQPPPPIPEKPPLIQQIENHIRNVLQSTGSAQLLRQRLMQIASPKEAAQAEVALLSMIDAVPRMLSAIAVAGDQAQIGHLLAPIIKTAAQYFLEPEDLIPDTAGSIGILDDAYLVHAFLHRINAEFVAQTGRPLVAVEIDYAIHLMRAVLGPAHSAQLDYSVDQTVQAVIQQSYAQQLAQWQLGHGMSAAQPDPEQWSWGGSNEDEIARLAAKIRCGS